MVGHGSGKNRCCLSPVFLRLGYSRLAIHIVMTAACLGVLLSGVVAGAAEATSPDDYFSMDLAELTAIKVTVSSHDSLDVFATPSTVTVIGHDMIASYKFLDVAEALSYVAGLDVYQTIIDRNVPTARGILQNFYANKILLLINNTPTWQPIYGEGYIDRINLADVERIEVLKGPASVLYGSNAYAGVINLVLRDFASRIGGVHARIGVPDLAEAGLNLNSRVGEFQVFLAANVASETRSPYTVTGRAGQPFNGSLDYEMTERYESRNFNLVTRFRDHTLLVNGFRYDHTFFGSAPSYVSGGGQMVVNRGLLAAYRYDTRLGDKTRLKGNISFDQFEREFSLSLDRTNTIALSGDRALADLVGIFDLGPQTHLEVGGTAENRHSDGHDTRDAVQDTLVRHNLICDNDVFEWSGFAQLSHDFKGLNVLAGTRYTNNDLFGDNVSSRVSAVLGLGAQRSVKAIWGQSFRVPTMFELYFDHPTVVGNPALQPETSTSWEVAYLARTGHFFYQVLGYYAQYSDLIQRVTPDSGPPSVQQNVDAFDGRGAEVELRYQEGTRSRVFLNYTLVDGVGPAAEDNFRYVARHTVKAGMRLQFGRLAVGALGKALSGVDGHLARIPAQYLLDLSLGLAQTVGEHTVRHSVSLKNVTNSDMLVAEYIRQTPNINSLATTGFGRRLVYSVELDF